MPAHVLRFRDDDAFYAELLAALKSRKAVVVETPFRSAGELPKRLNDIFELSSHGRGTWQNMASGMFVAGTVASAATAVGMNYKPLIVIGTTAAGTGVGFLIGAGAGGVGAGPGAAAGAVIGLGVGTVAAVLMDGKHKAEVEIDPSGRLKIHVTPT